MLHSSVPVLPALDGVVVTGVGVEAFDCPVCGCARDLVVPVCDDGPHERDDDCPDRACAVCGLALVVGSMYGEPAIESLGTRRAG